MLFKPLQPIGAAIMNWERCLSRNSQITGSSSLDITHGNLGRDCLYDMGDLVIAQWKPLGISN